MLARNFYKFKLLALALAFSINVMLLFFKVSDCFYFAFASIIEFFNSLAVISCVSIYDLLMRIYLELDSRSGTVRQPCKIFFPTMPFDAATSP